MLKDAIKRHRCRAWQVQAQTARCGMHLDCIHGCRLLIITNGFFFILFDVKLDLTPLIEQGGVNVT